MMQTLDKSIVVTDLKRNCQEYNSSQSLTWILWDFLVALGKLLMELLIFNLVSKLLFNPNLAYCKKRKKRA